MSEYWVSKKKYYCKYCEIYIADDAPSRQQHETGLRHKGNKERFVRGLYKSSEKKKHDTEEERREMERVERAAEAAFARDVSAGHAKAGPSKSASPGPSTSAAAKKPPPPKPATPWANYSTAESLGFTDPDAERFAAEAERRRTMGVAGEWELLAPEASGAAPAQEGAAVSVAGVKRAAEEAEAEAPVDEDDTRQFKLRKKTLGTGLGELWDPGLVPIKLKARKPEGAAGADALGLGTGAVAALANPNATAVPKWTAKGWNKPGSAPVKDEEREQDAGEKKGPADSDPSDLPDTLDQSKAPGSSVKQGVPDPSPEPVVKQEESAVKPEPVVDDVPLPAGGMFRKRKLPAGSAGTRAKRQY